MQQSQDIRPVDLLEYISHISWNVHSLGRQLDIMLQSVGFTDEYHYQLAYTTKINLEHLSGAFTNILHYNFYNKVYYHAPYDVETLDRECAWPEENDVDTMTETKADEKDSVISAMENEVKSLKEVIAQREAELSKCLVQMKELEKNQQDVATVETMTRENNAIIEELFKVESDNAMLSSKLEASATTIAELMATIETYKAEAAKAVEAAAIREKESKPVDTPSDSVPTERPLKKNKLSTGSCQNIFELVSNVPNVQCKSKSVEPTLPKPLVNGFKEVTTKRKPTKKPSPSGLSSNELYQLDWRSINDSETYLTHFKVKRGMEMDYTDGMYDESIQIIWKNPDVYSGDGSPYKYIGMVPASNGFFYRYDPENKRYCLAVHKDKFQRWDVGAYYRSL